MSTARTTSRAKATRKASKVRRPGPRDSKKPAASRVGSETKASKVLALLRSKTGATLPDLMAATGWQATTESYVSRRGLAVLFIVAVASSTAAVAGRPLVTQGRSIVVFYGDLNLRRREGWQTAYARVRAAARAVCGHVDFYNLPLQRWWRQCYKAAIDNAVVQLEKARAMALRSADAVSERRERYEALRLICRNGREDRERKRRCGGR